MLELGLRWSFDWAPGPGVGPGVLVELMRRRVRQGAALRTSLEDGERGAVVVEGEVLAEEIVDEHVLVGQFNTRCVLHRPPRSLS